MIDTFVIFPALFLLAWALLGGRTYAILAWAAFANIVIYPASAVDHVVVEATLDALVLLALIEYADKNRLWQIAVLSFAMLCHLWFEIDQAGGGNIILSDYNAVITLVTVLQLAGAAYAGVADILKRLWVADHYWRLCGRHHHEVDKETCRIEQQKPWK